MAEALRAGAVRECWATPEALEGREAGDLRALAGPAGLKPRLLSAGLLKRVADTETPQGWLAVVDTTASCAIAKPGPGLTLALDGLQDPGNLGTLLRTAWAVQAQVLMGKGCADPWSPKVLRAGAGAQFHVFIQESENLAASLSVLVSQGVYVLGASPRARQEFHSLKLDRAVCLVLGSEGAGLSPETANACQDLAGIGYPGSVQKLKSG